MAEQVNQQRTRKQWKLEGRGGLDCLKQHNSDPIPKPGDTGVLLRLKAASLNYRDIAIPKNKYPSKTADIIVPLSDGAGIVEAIGPEVTRFKVGDNVMPICLGTWISGRAPSPEEGIGTGMKDGVLQEYEVYDQQALVTMPSNYNYVQASTLPCAAVTSWNALFGLQGRRLMPGQWVLTQGTGGVSMWALQFAKAAGAKVVATTGSNDKVQNLKEAGADHVINYKEDKDWGATARNFTGKADGFDHVVDVGGAGTLGQSAKAVASQGVISLVGFLSAEGDMPTLLQCLYGGFIARGIGIGPREQFEEMVRAIEANDIMPHVDDKVFSFDQAKDAYRYLEDGKFFGKVVIEIG